MIVGRVRKERLSRAQDSMPFEHFKESAPRDSQYFSRLTSISVRQSQGLKNQMTFHLVES